MQTFFSLSIKNNTQVLLCNGIKYILRETKTFETLPVFVQSGNCITKSQMLEAKNMRHLV